MNPKNCEDQEIHQKHWKDKIGQQLVVPPRICFSILPNCANVFLLMFECCVTNASKLYGAYDSIGIDVVFFWQIFVTKQPKKMWHKSYKGFFLEFFFHKAIFQVKKN